MQGINPVGGPGQPQGPPPELSTGSTGTPPGPRAPGTAGAPSVTQAAAGHASSTSLLAQSSTTVTFVSQQVDMMLANIGQGVESQETLRLLIALLILQELLGNGNGNGSGPGAAGELLDMLSGNGNGNGASPGNDPSASVASLSSQTTMMQVHHEQTLAYSHQAVQGAAYSHYANAAGQGQTNPQHDYETDVTA